MTYLPGLPTGLELFQAKTKLEGRAVLEVIAAIYDFDKRIDVLDISENFTNIGNLITPVANQAGIYEVKFSIAYSFSDINDSVFIRFRVDGGPWFEFLDEPSDVTDLRGWFYAYPQEFAAGSHQVELEIRKEDAQANQLDVHFADTIMQLVDNTP